jgi:hypothetical protein
MKSKRVTVVESDNNRGRLPGSFLGSYGSRAALAGFARTCELVPQGTNVSLYHGKKSEL